jgi:hypothetical protein
MRVSGAIAVVLVVDLLASAAVRQALVMRNERAAIEAELSQEPYRETDWGRAYWEEIARYAEQWDPSVVYRVGNMHGRFINVDAGVRRTDNPEYPGSVHRHLVFLFGGSAAWGHGARDANTLPSWLARVAAEHGEAFEVRNYAESGWVNWQGIAYLLQKLSEGERPELVVFYSGVNETLSARRWPHVRRPIWDAEWYSSALHDSVIQRTRPLARTWEHYRSTSLVLSALFPPPLRIPVPPTAPETIVRTVVADYAADKEVVERLGREYGFATVFVWQPTIAAKPTLSAQERTYAGWLPSPPEARPGLEWWSMPQDLREMYDAIGREVVSHHGVVDLSHAFGDMAATAFIDWMHTSESGNERVARVLYDTLAPELPERKQATRLER